MSWQSRRYQGTTLRSCDLQVTIYRNARARRLPKKLKHSQIGQLKLEETSAQWWMVVSYASLELRRWLWTSVWFPAGNKVLKAPTSPLGFVSLCAEHLRIFCLLMTRDGYFIHPETNVVGLKPSNRARPNSFRSPSTEYNSRFMQSQPTGIWPEDTMEWSWWPTN